MRFDLVTNTMVKTALKEHRIVIHNPHLWRPLIDVEDACQAYVCALEADLAVTGIFNISAANYTLEDLGQIVASTVAEFGIDVSIQTEHRADVRSYRVNTDKATEVLGFRAEKPMSETVRDLVRNLQTSSIDVDDPRYYNILQFERLMASGQLHQNGHTAVPAPALLAAEPV